MIKLSHYIYKMAIDNNIHKKQVALMKFLSKATKNLEGAKGFNASKYIYVVGGAIRNYILNQPIKDLDLVIDSIAATKDLHKQFSNIKETLDSAWLAKEISKKIPCSTEITLDPYLVAKVSVTGDWVLDGIDMKGEVLDIANTRSESYRDGDHKPDLTTIKPATLEQDVYRREFTFNTLMWDLDSLVDGPNEKHKINRDSGGHVLDITGRGLNDLNNKDLATPSDAVKTFTDDPTRLLRVIKFVTKYNFKVSDDLRSVIKKCAYKLNKLKDIKNEKGEKIGEDQVIPNGELINLLKEHLTGSESERYFKNLKEFGLWEPLLNRLKKDKEKINSIHPKDPSREVASSFYNSIVNSLNFKQKPKINSKGELEESSVTHPLTALDMINSGLEVENDISNILKTTEERSKLKSYIENMSKEEGIEYIQNLIKPSVDNNKLMQFGIKQKTLHSLITPIARKIVLEHPEIFNKKEEITNKVLQKIQEMGLTAA